MSEVKEAYRKEYQIRIPVEGRNSFVITLPYEVVEREARRRELTTTEFTKKFQIVALYDNFEGVHYIFEEKPDSNSITSTNG